MLKLICYGGGAGFRDFFFHLRSEKAEIVALIDKNSQGG